MDYESKSKDELIALIKEQNQVIDSLKGSHDKPQCVEQKLNSHLALELNDKSRSRDWLEHSPICTKVVDLDLNLQYMSRSGVEALNIADINEYYGSPYPFHFYPDSFKIPMTQNLKKSIATGEIIDQTASVVDVDGNELWFHSTIVPVKDDQQKIEYLIVVSIEISDQKKAEKEKDQMLEQLVIAKDKAEKADKAKTEFLATMSHEIRTPMNGVICITDIMLKDKSLSNEQRKCLETVQSSGNVLISIIDDILDFSKIESGRMKFEHVPFFIEDTVNNVISLFKYKAEEKGVSLTCNKLGKPDLYIEGDPGRLRQVLVNLVSNAVKFTHEGTVQLEYQIKEETENYVVLKFELKDTGIGINKESIPILFDSFSQADMSTTRKYGGTGLGLAICKKLIDSMKGEIGVNSIEGEGSCFWFELSFEKNNEYFDSKEQKAIESKEPKHEEPPESSKIKALIVDDNDVNLDVLERIVKKAGIQCDRALNGQIAVDLFEQNEYQLILMDIYMPIMDGLAATQAIRKLDKGKDIPIFGISANVLPEQTQKCFEVGMNEFISKPIDIDHLISLIHQYCSETVH